MAGVALRLIAIVSWSPAVTTLTDAYETFASSTVQRSHAPRSVLADRRGSGPGDPRDCGDGPPPASDRDRLRAPAAGPQRAASPDQLGPDYCQPASCCSIPISSFWSTRSCRKAGLCSRSPLGYTRRYGPWTSPDRGGAGRCSPGLSSALAVTIRTAALFVIPVVILALLLCRSRSSEHWGAHWRAALAVLGVSAALLLAFATANATLGERFGLGASPGWYLYGGSPTSPTAANSPRPRAATSLCED